jgi:hypothetical protein
MLGRVFATLRVHSGQRRPANDAERSVNDALNAQGASAAATRRMVATLDAMPESARASLLGDIAAPDFVPSETVAPTTLNVTFSTDMINRMGTIRTPAIPGHHEGPTTTPGHDGGPLGDQPTIAPDGPRPKPVYTIQYKGLWCQDETTWDRFSSGDEIYLITSAVHIDANGQNIVRTERHPAAQTEIWYGDVNSAEERTGPVAACWFENSDPVSLTVVVVEHDEGDPDAYRDEIDALVKAIIAVLVFFYPELKWVELLSTPIADAVNWVLGTGDDPLEMKTVVLPRALLEQYAGQWPAPYIGSRTDSGGLFGSATVIPVVTNVMQHFITSHNGGGASYVAGFEIVREPPIDRPIILL